LKKFKQYFKGWGYNSRGANKKIKEQWRGELMVLEQIEEDNVLSLQQMQRKVEINSCLLKILEEEELYWHKRSHEKWLHEGDNNTEYFHRVANGRKRKNTIISLASDGGVIEGVDNLINHATDFYKNLFGETQSCTIKLDESLWGGDEKNELCRQ
jgi:hypothetical protein